MANQSLLAKFYDINNLLNIEIVIPQATWDDLRNADPHFGWRGQTSKADLDKWNGHRYDWTTATSVTISGSKYPPAPTKAFSNVGIVKKSFVGSASKSKPSFKIDFGHKPNNATQAQNDAAKKNKKDAEALFGTSGLTLNNCKQDASFIRQPLGYEIFRQSMVPWLRCNFAKIIIRGTDHNVLLTGLWCNLEQAKEAFVERQFKNDKGNLYETEIMFDLTNDSLAKTFDQSGFSDFEDQADMKVAIDQIDKGVGEASKILDVDQMLKVFTVCGTLKHWDGYPNNTYFYNNVKAVQKPGLADVKLEMIPFGIDQILQPGRKFEVENSGVLTKLLFADPSSRQKLKLLVDASAAQFPQILPGVLKYVDGMKDVLKAAGVWSEVLAKEVQTVVDQLNMIKAGMVTIAA